MALPRQSLRPQHSLTHTLSHTRARLQHPYLQQPKLLRFCAAEGIHVTGFSPLGASSYVPLGTDPAESALLHPAIAAIAARTGASPAQVCLAWAVRAGRSVVPKSVSAARLAENLAALAMPELTQEELAALAALDRGRRFNDPGVFCAYCCARAALLPAPATFSSPLPPLLPYCAGEGAFNTFTPIYE